jgi:hypothetical protein
VLGVEGAASALRSDRKSRSLSRPSSARCAFRRRPPLQIDRLARRVSFSSDES